MPFLGMLLSRDSRVDMEMRQYKTQAFVDSLQSTSTDNRSPPNTNTSADTVQLNGSTQEEPSTHSHSHSHPHSHPHPHPQPHPHPHPQRELELESVSKEQAGTGTSVSASGNTVTLSGEERQPHTTDYCGTQNKGAGVETVRNTPGSINQVLKACSINEVEKEQATTATGKHVTYRQPSANESYATDGMSDDIECEGPPASEPSADRCVQAKSGPEDPNLGYRRTGKRLMYVKGMYVCGGVYPVATHIV
ncbi:hypothetical protein SARC_15457 [Sphaeroforma arctica JP610]|uniref:Uncharacterized protein n=1 Tax=Sphaeroforma arctica JP610 TaxID=667725 RepID=A0A0L0F5Y1_9EUKA|nr:hypothetical protein SARC_15457 [Sphaeroforma arctica JP610]KNC71996.1 hypothetical protein SARC_15457 [Sphaeroforma arctica JP610]|eukprot:XP_014145898.1 hypothetical protein SARC_15457 [Sphaeroforma arctica JP610]